MKQKIFSFIVICLICFSLYGCSFSQGKEDFKSNQPNEPYNTVTSITSISPTSNTSTLVNSDDIDVDLTKLSSTMVYSEVYNMMTSPNDYIGKRIKMRGKFSVYKDESLEKNYFAVVIADAAGCCQQGLEFVLSDNAVYPDDYPKEQAEITVEGIFKTYNEGDTQFCHIINAKIVEQ